MITTRVLAGLVLAATTSTAAMAADLTPVKFGTNWLPQAEHGGYYQAEKRRSSSVKGAQSTSKIFRNRYGFLLGFGLLPSPGWEGSTAKLGGFKPLTF